MVRILLTEWAAEGRVPCWLWPLACTGYPTCFFVRQLRGRSVRAQHTRNDVEPCPRRSPVASTIRRYVPRVRSSESCKRSSSDSLFVREPRPSSRIWRTQWRRLSGGTHFIEDDVSECTANAGCALPAGLPVGYDRVGQRLPIGLVDASPAHVSICQHARQQLRLTVNVTREAYWSSFFPHVPGGTPGLIEVAWVALAEMTIIAGAGRIMDDGACAAER